MKQDIEFYEIDGLNFTTQEFDYDVGAPLLWRLFKMCGKSVLAFLFEGVSGLIKELASGEVTKEEVDSMDTVEMIKRLDKSKVVEAIDYFLQNIDPEEMVKPDGTGLQQKILKTTWIVDKETKNRRDINWKLDFKGKYGTSFKLLKHVLMLQYASVFQNVLSGSDDQSKTTKKVVGKMLVAK